MLPWYWLDFHPLALRYYLQASPDVILTNAGLAFDYPCILATALPAIIGQHYDNQLASKEKTKIGCS